MDGEPQWSPGMGVARSQEQQVQERSDREHRGAAMLGRGKPGKYD